MSSRRSLASTTATTSVSSLRGGGRGLPRPQGPSTPTIGTHMSTAINIDRYPIPTLLSRRLGRHGLIRRRPWLRGPRRPAPRRPYRRRRSTRPETGSRRIRTSPGRRPRPDGVRQRVQPRLSRLVSGMSFPTQSCQAPGWQCWVHADMPARLRAGDHERQPAESRKTRTHRSSPGPRWRIRRNSKANRARHILPSCHAPGTL